MLDDTITPSCEEIVKRLCRMCVLLAAADSGFRAIFRCQAECVEQMRVGFARHRAGRATIEREHRLHGIRNGVTVRARGKMPFDFFAQCGIEFAIHEIGEARDQFLARGRGCVFHHAFRCARV